MAVAWPDRNTGARAGPAAGISLAGLADDALDRADPCRDSGHPGRHGGRLQQRRRTPRPRPSPGGGGGSAGVVYSALGASDTAGVGSSVECFPFSPCPNGMGYVQLLERRLRETGAVTLYNRGVPGAVLSPTIEEVGPPRRPHLPGQHPDQPVAVHPPGQHRRHRVRRPNDANTIGQVMRGPARRRRSARLHRSAGAAVGRRLRARCCARSASARPARAIVLINLPNLAAMPYFAARSTFQKSIMQRIAVSMNDHVNALARRKRARRRRHVRPAGPRAVQLLGRRLPPERSRLRADGGADLSGDGQRLASGARPPTAASGTSSRPTDRGATTARTRQSPASLTPEPQP